MRCAYISSTTGDECNLERCLPVSTYQWRVLLVVVLPHRWRGWRGPIECRRIVSAQILWRYPCAFGMCAEPLGPEPCVSVANQLLPLSFQRDVYLGRALTTRLVRTWSSLSSSSSTACVKQFLESDIKQRCGACDDIFERSN